MTPFHFAKTRALVAVDLGIVATALALGCSSGSGPSGGEQTGSAKAAIRSQGITVHGCRARAVFDITSPTTIDFVAMDSPDMQDAQLQLFDVDDVERTTPILVTARQASPSMQALLEGATEQASQNAALRDLESSATSSSTQSSGGMRTNSQSADAIHQVSATSQRSTSAVSSSGQGSSATQGSGSTSGSAASTTNQATHVASAQSSASTLVFDQLSQIQSNHMMLVVDATAHQASSLLRVFQGSNAVVTDVQTFPITAATCGSVNASVPMVTPVARPRG